MLIIPVLQDLAHSQVINQVIIQPENPTSSDTVRVIIDFSYNGNCSFGLVYTYTNIEGSNIHLYPTYCGYGKKTLCHSVDTLTIDPQTPGDYTIHIEFHQGSICPISDFDALINHYDIALNVGVAASITQFESDDFFNFKLFPNPISRSAILESNRSLHNASIAIFNSAGRLVRELKNLNGMSIPLPLDDLINGIYFIQLTEDGKSLAAKSFIISY